MRPFLCSCLLLFAGSSVQDPGNPVAQLERFDLEVVYWEGTFGSYLHPAPGSVLVVDLGAVGSPGLTAVPLADEGAGEARLGHFDLAHLERVVDTVEGDAAHGWTRRVVLKGRRRPDASEQTVLELTIQHLVERYDVADGRRAKLSSNQTHVALRLHTLRDDDTIREYGRARAFHDRDTGVRVPATKKR